MTRKPHPQKIGMSLRNHIGDRRKIMKLHDWQI